MTNHFDTLGLKPGSSEDDIKKAYRNLAKKWHPDKNDSKDAEEKFKEISCAYDYLKSKDRREILERDLKREKEGYSKPNPTNFQSSCYKYGTGSKHNTTSYSRYYNSPSGKSDEDFTPSSKAKNETLGKKYSKKGNNNLKKSQKSWSENWNEPSQDDWRRESEPNFSFAFKSFVNGLDASFSTLFSFDEPFEFESFFTGPDSFEEYFNKDRPYSPRPSPSPRNFNVAPETGYAGGLNREYLFSPLQEKPTFDDRRSFGADQEDDEDSGDDYSETRYKCPYCGKRLPLNELVSHEPSCKKRRFKLESDEEDGLEDEDPNNYRGTGNLKKTHEDLLRNVHMTRRAARGCQTAHENLRQVVCKWCGRFFSQLAADKHIPFCEKWTIDHGTPMSPAGHPTASHDMGSKTYRAKEYSKRIPKPKKYEEKYKSDQGRTYGNASFPNVGIPKWKSSVYDYPTATGSHTPPHRDQGGAHTPKQGKPFQTRKADLNFPSPKIRTSTSFNNEARLGSGLKGNGFNEGCSVCQQKFGRRAKFACSCGLKKTNL